jgi:hypothetical protein
MEKPVAKETTKEQIIIGGGETMQERQVESEKKRKQTLNEGA